MKAYMYILHCSGGSYYIGSTHDLERRMEEHLKVREQILQGDIYLLNYCTTKSLTE